MDSLVLSCSGKYVFKTVDVFVASRVFGTKNNFLHFLLGSIYFFRKHVFSPSLSENFNVPSYSVTPL
jgi:hypothetical protein